MNVQKMMKQAQQMQANLARAQEEIAEMEFEGTSGGGAVKAVTTGGGDLKALTIAPDVLQDGDAEMLSDLVLTAVNAALASGKNYTQEKMSSLTGGLGGMGLPGF